MNDEPARPTHARHLGPWQVRGVSLGVMGLSLSANINPQGAAPTAGRAIPLTIVIATIAVAFLSHSFYRLSQHFETSGSAFGFVGAVLGPRAGAVAGWCLLGGYLIFGAGSCYGAAIFFNALLQSMGVGTVGAWVPYVVTLALLAIATAFAVIPARRGTTVLLVLEALTVSLILLISVVVIVKLAAGSGPPEAKLTLSVFRPEPGTGTSSLFLGAVFGVLAFIGFEGAATMGEEAKEPRRSIPRALFGTVVIGGVFYVFTSAVEVMGFGTSSAAMGRFQASSSLFGSLGSTYLTSWIGDVVTIGTMLSALAGAIGCIVGASRIILAMSRAVTTSDSAIQRISGRFGTPVGAIELAVAAMTLSVLAFGFVFRAIINHAWAWTGTIGTLIVLVAYLLVTVSAAVMIRSSRTIAAAEIVVPVIAFCVLGYIIYRNVVPYPVGPGRWLPLAAAAWTLLAVVVVLVSPSFTRRIGQELALEGLTLGALGEVGADPVVAPTGSPAASSHRG